MNIIRNIEEIWKKKDAAPSSALLIDADNFNHERIGEVIRGLSSFSSVPIRLAVGNWAKDELASWVPELQKYAIRPIQQFDVTKGKNATDIALTVRAMEVLYNNNIDIFVIVASDSDYCPLALKLREEGKIVVGFGSREAPPAFRNSCNDFVVLDGVVNKQMPIFEAVPGNQLKGDSKLMSLLRDTVESAADKNGWAHLGDVEMGICNQVIFDPTSRGYPSILSLFEAVDIFEVEANGNSVLIRDRRKRIA